MAQVTVTFEREHGAGLKASSVYIDGDRLSFENNRADKRLETGTEVEVYWRILGNPGSALTIKYTFGGVTKTAVKDSAIAKNKTRKSDFTFIKL
jgi:hypothetical protein